MRLVTQMNLKGEEEGVLFAPYSSVLNNLLRRINAKFHHSTGGWIVDPDLLETIHDAVQQQFGCTWKDYDPKKWVKCTMSVPEDLRSDELYVGGWQILKKWSRDQAPVMSTLHKVHVLEGELKKQGGSRRYPYITAAPGTVIGFRIPRPLAERLAKEGVVTIVEKGDEHEDS